MPEISVGVDFLQYSIKVGAGMFTGLTEWTHHLDMLHKILDETLGEWAEVLFDSVWVDGDNKIKPYSHSLTMMTHGNVRLGNIYWSDKSIDSITIQHTGSGCGVIPHILNYADYVRTRLNRIDLALDCVCDDQPATYFYAYTGRLSKSFEDSRNGQTFYIGSRKSDKLIRIYRYAKPHERAHTIRFEIQLKGEYARGVTDHIVTSSLFDVVAGLIVATGLPVSHILSGEMLKIHLTKRKNGDTLLWLERTVKPTIQRLVREGEFDPIVWIRKIMDEMNAF